MVCACAGTIPEVRAPEAVLKLLEGGSPLEGGAPIGTVIRNMISPAAAPLGGIGVLLPHLQVAEVPTKGTLSLDNVDAERIICKM